MSPVPVLHIEMENQLVRCVRAESQSALASGQLQTFCTSQYPDRRGAATTSVVVAAHKELETSTRLALLAQPQVM